MSHPLPGWYPDPETPERQRFWDGNQWTEVRSHPGIDVDHPDVPNIVGPVPGGKRRSRPWIVVAIIAVVAAILFAVAWYFLLRDSGEQAPPVAPVAPSASPTSTSASPTLPPGA